MKRRWEQADAREGAALAGASRGTGETRRTRIVFPAMFCGLCAYVPIPGLRGALFCLFPTLAGGAKGESRAIIWGAVADFILSMLVIQLGMCSAPDRRRGIISGWGQVPFNH